MPRQKKEVEKTKTIEEVISEQLANIEWWLDIYRSQSENAKNEIEINEKRKTQLENALKALKD